MSATKQRPVRQHLTLQNCHFGVPPLDQADKLSNHSRALCSTGCELLVLICELPRGSGVGCKLGVAGSSTPRQLLQLAM